jgi:hypothetical protein
MKINQFYLVNAKKFLNDIVHQKFPAIMVSEVDCSGRDVQQRVDRGSMLWFQRHMIYSPETKCNIRWPQFYTQITLVTNLLSRKIAHSVRAGPSSSRPTCPSFFFLLHAASSLTERWLLIFLAFWGAGSSLTPPPLSWPHFPQVPGNAPLPCRAQWTYAILVRSSPV